MKTRVYRSESFTCPACGNRHSNEIDEIVVGAGAIGELATAPQRLGLGSNAMLITDEAIMGIMGGNIVAQLEKGGCTVRTLAYPLPTLPDEKRLMAFLQLYDAEVDFFVAAGTGVVNDITRYFSHKLKKPYISIPSAPSMDGYSAKVALLFIDGVKQTLDATYPKAIYADTEVLKNSPKRLLAAGVGDLAAKITACAEWKISGLVNGEFCCDHTAERATGIARECLEVAPGLAEKDEAAVLSLMDGLLFSGIAMQWVGSSRPAAGAEHHITHYWGMMSGAPQHLHGAEVAVGTLIILQAYEELLKLDFSTVDAAAVAASMPDRPTWETMIREICPNQAPVFFKQQEKKSFDHKEIEARIRRIQEKEQEIKEILRAAAAYREPLLQALQILGAPTTPQELGVSAEDLRTSFLWSKEMRPKYVLYDLAYDLGVLEDLADRLFG